MSQETRDARKDRLSTKLAKLLKKQTTAIDAPSDRTYFENRINQIASAREKGVESADIAGAVQSLAQAFTQYYAAKKGAESGIDMSGLDFKGVDWERRADRARQLAQDKEQSLLSEIGLRRADRAEGKERIAATQGELAGIKKEEDFDSFISKYKKIIPGIENAKDMEQAKMAIDLWKTQGARNANILKQTEERNKYAASLGLKIQESFPEYKEITKTANAVHDLKKLLEDAELKNKDGTIMGYDAIKLDNIRIRINSLSGAGVPSAQELAMLTGNPNYKSITDAWLRQKIQGTGTKNQFDGLGRLINTYTTALNQRVDRNSKVIREKYKNEIKDYPRLNDILSFGEIKVKPIAGISHHILPKKSLSREQEDARQKQIEADFRVNKTKKKTKLQQEVDSRLKKLYNID
jgi:hypothetical protein